MAQDGEYRRLRLVGLAWDLVACGMRPPMHPTTCAVLRALSLRSMSFKQLSRLLPCDEATIRQQLARLQRAGLVGRLAERARGARAYVLFFLSPEGRLLARRWDEAHARSLARLEADDDVGEEGA